MIDEKLIRKEFPMLSNPPLMQGHPLVWLDNASTTFKPQCVLDAVSSYYISRTSNSHRGDYDLCYSMDVETELTRKAVSKLINCSPNEVVFTSGTTDSLNRLAQSLQYGLKKGDEIIISQSEHASNVLPWFQIAKHTGVVIKYVELQKDGLITVENLRKTLSKRTKIVSLAQVGNVLGQIQPIKELVAETHKYGAIFIVDGAQSVPHMPVDVKDLDCDFLCFSGHKICGPTGIGVLYGKYKLLEDLELNSVGGGMNDKFYLDGTIKPSKAPAKFEAGTQNLEGILGLRAAIEFIMKIGLENIAEHEHKLKKYAVERIKELGNSVIYNADAKSGIVTFNINDVFAQDAATYLNSKGIACRSGQHCAKLLNDFIGTPATIRASFYFYTTKEDIDKLVDAVSHGKEFLDAYF